MAQTDKYEDAIGRSRSGDQLHIFTVVTRETGIFSGNNARCNNHMHLQALTAPGGQKASVRMRPGLFCRKCFGTDEATIIGREYRNAVVIAKADGLKCEAA